MLFRLTSLLACNTASSQSDSQSGSSWSPRAHHTVSGDGSAPLGLNTNTEYLLARATQVHSGRVRGRCAVNVTCVRRWYRYSVLEWGLVVAEGVSEAAGAYTRSIIRGTVSTQNALYSLDSARGVSAVSFSEP